MNEEQKKQYEQYLGALKHWARTFPTLDDKDLKTLLYRAAEADMSPMAFWNTLSDTPEAIIKNNKLIEESFSIWETEKEGIKNKGVDTHYIIVIFNYLKRLDHFQTVEEIHQGIVKAYESMARKYERAGDKNQAAAARERIPEQGTISGRLLELQTAGIANKVKVARDNIKGGVKGTKMVRGYKLPLDLQTEPWGVVLQNRWKEAVKSLNNKNTNEKLAARILEDLKHNIYLTPHEKAAAAQSLVDIYKVYFFDPIESAFDELKNIEKEINIKANEEKEFKKIERAEKQKEFDKSKALGEAMRKEMNLTSIDFKDNGSTWKEQNEQKDWAAYQAKADEESRIMKEKMDRAREQSDAIMKRHGLGPYKK